MLNLYPTAVARLARLMDSPDEDIWDSKAIIVQLRFTFGEAVPAVDRGDKGDELERAHSARCSPRRNSSSRTWRSRPSRRRTGCTPPLPGLPARSPGKPPETVPAGQTACRPGAGSPAGRGPVGAAAGGTPGTGNAGYTTRCATCKGCGCHRLRGPYNRAITSRPGGTWAPKEGGNEGHTDGHDHRWNAAPCI